MLRWNGLRNYGPGGELEVRAKRSGKQLKRGDDNHMSRDISMSALMLQLAEVVTHLDLPGHRSPHFSQISKNLMSDVVS